jgi:mannose-6-phosphate isomerase class I
MGLGWDVALDMIDYTGVSASEALGRARQSPRVLRSSHGSREVRLFQDDVLQFFDGTVLEVEDEIYTDDGRFCVAVVMSGDGFLEGEFGAQAIRRGETYALAASLPFRVKAGREPLRVVRCFGPDVGGS